MVFNDTMPLLDGVYCPLELHLAKKKKNSLSSTHYLLTIISCRFLNVRIVHLGTSLVVQWLRLYFPRQGVWVRSLIGELRSHMLQGQKINTVKQKQSYNKFNKDFKNGPHQKYLMGKKKGIAHLPSKACKDSDNKLRQKKLPGSSYLPIFPSFWGERIEHSKQSPQPVT